MPSARLQADACGAGHRPRGQLGAAGHRRPSDAAAAELLTARICNVYKKSDSTISPDMEERASHILKRCQGLPLAISTIGCFHANRPKTSTEWRNLHEHLGAELEFGLHHIPEVIVSSYDGLPYDLKSIFLYFSIFPENHDIRRTRLLRRWMAEGLITKNRDMPVEKVAERSYKELINRSMIQPLKAKADRCHVHNILRQIILFKSIEENQLFLVEKQSNEVPQSKTRHLVVSRWENKDEKLRNINPSYIRSLTIFGECPLSIISPKMRLLRVLDLEDTDNLKNDDLKHIGELRHLRYLSLRGTSISKLPSSLQNLRYLETLDVQDTQVMQLPSHVAKLEKLCYLLAGSNFSKDLLQKMKSGEENHKFGLMPCLGCKSCEGLFGLELTKAAWQSSQASNFGCLGLRSLPGQQAACQDSIQTDPERSKVFNMCVRAPEGIEKLMNLHTLGVVNFGYGNGVAGRLKKLTNLTNLRRLGVEGLTEKEGKDLCQSISGLRRLERFEVRSDSLTFLTQMDEDESAGPRVGPPKILRYLVSLRLCGNLSSMPKWIGSLNDLAKLKLLRTKLKQGDIEGLQNLRNLTLLGLWENSYIGDSLLFCADTFPKLKFLDIDGLDEIKTVEIRKGAMPELKKLSVMKCPSLQDSESGLSGVPDLLNLNEVVLKQCGNKEMLTKILQGQISDHIKRPKLLVGKSIGRPTSGTVTAEQR
ncbi:hypothetical protein HU200_000754 [Digitaria exilis]|uniref:NB-ARC domain-containing protein n=1 Tax=Digitaria exilis TaxID=1010633 RepID=A0A835G1S4_9POAL|nr:hypothetical protein HU200_000754 [Digitaria exilis]